MSRIKANFKYINNNIKEKFKHSQCLLTVSIGQETHEGERFAATVDLINASFNSCIITLHDSLQRYTIALDKNEEPQAFYETAVKEGDLWLNRNKEHLDKLTILQKVIRWDTWIKHSNYQMELNNIRTLLKNNYSFKAIFDHTIDEYLSRYDKRLHDATKFNKERARKLCFDYLIEECAVLCLWPETNCEFELYPGKHNPAVEETRKRLIFTNYPNLLHAVAIGFNHRRDLRPQHFETVQK